jgi:salicylate synthetase
MMDASSIRLFISAVEQLPPSIWEAFRQYYGYEICEGLGATEMLHIYLSNRPGRCKPGFVGWPVPGYDIRIVCKSGEDLPASEAGTLAVTGGSLMLGYFNRATETKNAMEGATLKTSDICLRDEDGAIRLLGRSDDLIKVNGLWVSPGEVEDVLIQHPEVIECAVVLAPAVGIQLPTLNAYLVLDPKGGNVPAAMEEVLQFARSKLPRHKVPRQIYIRRDLPRTPTGKLDRKRLIAGTAGAGPSAPAERIGADVSSSHRATSELRMIQKFVSGIGYADRIGVLRQLQGKGLAKEFFLYCDDNVATIALNSLYRITVDSSQLTFANIVTGEAIIEPLFEPLLQVQRILEKVPLQDWRCFGYIAFDFAKFYYPFEKCGDGPLLDMIIPETTLKFQADGVEISTCRDLGPLLDCLNISDGDDYRSATPHKVNLDDSQRELYFDQVHRLRSLIRQRKLRKAIVARSVSIRGDLDVVETYARANRENRAERSYAFNFDQVKGVGFSPETLLTLDAERLLTTCVLAATRPRSQDPVEDHRLEEELFEDAKEVKEHAISVQLSEEEVGSVCARESVRIYEFMQVTKYRHVQHLGSKVSGTLQKGWTLFDAIRALFPAITVSGVPKADALHSIDLIEGMPRGIYAGVVGWLDSEGCADLALAIRSAFQYGSTVHLNAGAGIVAESDEAFEYTESANKMNTIAERIVVWPVHE